MIRNKIDYGIDLGTTNSAICRMEKGKPAIIKSDVQGDIMPSCVSVKKNGNVCVGAESSSRLKSDKIRATRDWNKLDSHAYIEFKRTMATDIKYPCSFLGRELTSEELSAEVLKRLKSFVLDENFSSVVITVPAKFTVNQKTATMEAAKMAGFSRCELLQEPVAAAMAYGLTAEDKNGIWMVFDFGGGTFDAALMKVEDGIMQVFDTEGDNYLGGKNLDYAIVDGIIIPYLKENYDIDGILQDPEKKEILREAMKVYAEPAKNQLSFTDSYDIISDLGDLGNDDNGEELELDLTLTRQHTFEVMRPLFQRAVDICKSLLQRNNISGSQLSRLILVGGPTHSPLIRQMLKEQITPNVDTSIDPMTAVAVGAALYASTIDADVADSDLQLGTVKLNVGFEPTTVELQQYVTVSLANDSSVSKAYAEFIRGTDGNWSSGKVAIDGKGDVVELKLQENRSNMFSIRCYDGLGNTLPCFPEQITILQGTVVSSAPLPYNIGIAIWNKDKKRGVFRMAKGLEKNKPLPAVGVVNELKTSCALRPGVAEDRLVVPIYQVDDFSEAEGKTASLYEHVADVDITGDDVDTLIAEDSLVDITLKVDSSEQMKLEVYFLSADMTVEKTLDTGKKHSMADADKEIRRGFAEADSGMRVLAGGGIDTDDLQEQLAAIKTDYENTPEKKEVLNHLRELLRKIEELDAGTEWQRLEQELREEFDNLERAQNDLGDSKTAMEVNQLRSQVDDVIRTQNVRLGRDVKEKVVDLYVQLTMVYQCMGLIRHYNDRFGTIRWKDSLRARQLVNRGMEEINSHPTVDKLHPIACELIDLMPDCEAEKAGGLLK